MSTATADTAIERAWPGTDEPRRAAPRGRPADGVGLVQTRRMRFDFPPAAPFALELGGALPRFTLAYETYGRLNAARDNAILLIHALTGDAHAAGRHRPDDRQAGWWDPLIGPGRPLDTDRYFVVCGNALGGCAGSTGPCADDPAAGRPYGGRFPLVTVADLVRAQRLLLDRLGVARLHAVLGGSLGGMQALEWAVRYPDVVARAGVIAAAGRLGPQGIALNEIGRRAIMLDPAWRDGDYAPGAGPAGGLALARMVGMVTYHSKESMALRFGRRAATRPTRYPAFGGTFDVEGYLHHHGDLLVARFDAHSYLRQTRAMDLYDVAVGRGSDAAALGRVRARVLALGIRSDWLFPPDEVRALAGDLAAAGVAATYRELDSPHGHDAFLKEWDLLDPVLHELLN
ncbi:MAG TPA: homoserine O-acetyltransferase [Thermomicrobiales bacterium]|nr:homoserine O-acetyltransferase [Thermomicrobiales bacterium]